MKSHVSKWIEEWLQFVLNSTNLRYMSHRQQYLDPGHTLTDHWRVGKFLEVAENNLLRALSKVLFIVLTYTFM